MAPQPWRSEDTLRELYINQGLSQDRIAARLGCTQKTVSKWIHRLGVRKDTAKQCPCCGRYFDEIGTHWRHAKYPEIADELKAIFRGLLMGDGWLHHRKRNGYLAIKNTNITFLNYLDEIFGAFSKGVKKEKTSGELAAEAFEREFDPDAMEHNYRAIYRLRTASHPYFRRMAKTWHNHDRKQFRDTLELTPTTLKMWYACDGSLNWSTGRTPMLTITTVNEMERPDYLHALFTSIGFTPRVRGKDIRFSTEATRNVLAWMGEAPPGFEYKWETESRDRYNTLKHAAYPSQ